MADFSLLVDIKDGKKVDGRKIRPFRSRGYVSEDNTLTLDGYYALGIFPNKPVLDYETKFFSDNDYVVVEEVAYNQENDTEYSRTRYYLSANKLMEFYDVYMTETQANIDKIWNKTYDREKNKSFADYVVRKAKDDALSEIFFNTFDIRYTSNIIVSICESILKGRIPSCVTSRKCSFGDTEWEADVFSVKPDGKEILTFNVEIFI